VLAVTLVIAGLFAASFIGGRWLLSRSYYVGTTNGEVAIYHGVPGSVGPIDTSWIAERTGVETGEIAPWYLRNLRDGVPAADLADARRIVANAPRADTDEEDGDVGDDPADEEDTEVG
jgi:PPM family protein phosphatase